MLRLPLFSVLISGAAVFSAAAHAETFPADGPLSFNTDSSKYDQLAKKYTESREATFTDAEGWHTGRCFEQPSSGADGNDPINQMVIMFTAGGAKKFAFGAADSDANPGAFDNYTAANAPEINAFIASSGSSIYPAESFEGSLISAYRQDIEFRLRVTGEGYLIGTRSTLCSYSPSGSPTICSLGQPFPHSTFYCYFFKKVGL